VGLLRRPSAVQLGHYVIAAALEGISVTTYPSCEDAMKAAFFGYNTSPRPT